MRNNAKRKDDFFVSKLFIKHFSGFILSNRDKQINFILEIMSNKYNHALYKHQQIDHNPTSLIPILQRQNYNRVLTRLNEQNQYLSLNMKQLIMENLALKNKLYHHTDSTYRAKDYAKYDVESNRKRTEWAYKQKNQSKYQKTQESRELNNRPKSWKLPANRQSENESVVKRPTIIEGLSDSQFENKGETNRSKNGEGRKGIKLSKQVYRQNKQRQQQEKYQKQQDQELKQQRYNDEIGKEDQQLNQIQRQKIAQKQSTSRIQTEQKNNPEKHETNQNYEKTKASRHKKDNTPYLKVKDPINGNYMVTPTKNKTFNNKAYLDYSAK